MNFIKYASSSLNNSERISLDFTKELINWKGASNHDLKNIMPKQTYKLIEVSDTLLNKFQKSKAHWKLSRSAEKEGQYQETGMRNRNEFQLFNSSDKEGKKMNAFMIRCFKMYWISDYSSNMTSEYNMRFKQILQKKLSIMFSYWKRIQ